MAINPYGPFPRRGIFESNVAVLKRMWEEEKKNPSLKREVDPKYWGSAFQHLPKLKYLTIEFETEKSCEEQIDAVAEYAKTWKFPMGKEGLLSAEGSKIQKWDWQGPLCMRNNKQRGLQQLYPTPLAVPTLPVPVNNTQTSQVSPQATIDPPHYVMPRPRHPEGEINRDAMKPILVGRTVRWNLAPI